MRNVGYIKMHRGWMDNEALRDNDERVLWVTIIERAAWEDTATFVNGVRVLVPRGSFITSLRTLSNKIDWDAKRVSRFLDRLEKCHMIVTVSDMGMTRVSVCNYDKYNPTRHTIATETAQQVIDAAVQLHGGKGVTKGYIVEALYRDIRALRIYEGASEVQTTIIARQTIANHT